MKKNKPLKIREVDRKQPQSLIEFADMLEDIATKLKAEGSFSVVEGDKTTVITPGSQLRTEFTYKTRGNKHEVEIQFKWRDNESNEPLTIK
ncbi:MAG: amphi-Trp domain-containing protein [Erysipelothrix sp.]|mgnify:CR=1 FL=1|nr:amphi-Trp domain-containing protein [Erysipelothrix sp.]